MFWSPAKPPFERPPLTEHCRDLGSSLGDKGAFCEDKPKFKLELGNEPSTLGSKNSGVVPPPWRHRIRGRWRVRSSISWSLGYIVERNDGDVVVIRRLNSQRPF
jgi:hypothetical protein